MYVNMFEFTVVREGGVWIHHRVRHIDECTFVCLNSPLCAKEAFGYTIVLDTSMYIGLCI